MDCYEKSFFQAMNGDLHMLQEQKPGKQFFVNWFFAKLFFFFHNYNQDKSIINVIQNIINISELF